MGVAVTTPNEVGDFYVYITLLFTYINYNSAFNISIRMLIEIL